MPYRSGERACAICQSLAAAWCYRCGRPLCRDHLHGSTTRCDRCEKWFDTNVAVEGKAKDPIEITSRAARVILLFTPLWPVGLAAILKQVARNRRRRRFLRERLPPVADATRSDTTKRSE